MEKLFSADTVKFSRAINLHRTKTTYVVKAEDETLAKRRIEGILEKGETISRLKEVVFDAEGSPVYLTITESLEHVNY